VWKEGYSVNGLYELAIRFLHDLTNGLEEQLNRTTLTVNSSLLGSNIVLSMVM